MIQKNQFILKVLGTIQDGGYPHPGCQKSCCQNISFHQDNPRYITSIALINAQSKEAWLFDITPDFNKQFHILEEFCPNVRIEGVFITHAHIGHYLGLSNLGLEVMNQKNVCVYVMPRMKEFLLNNDPYKFLIQSQNIYLYDLDENSDICLSSQISIKPFLVPHRNELSETVGYQIQSKLISCIYLPDIDSWDGWKDKLIDMIHKNDYLFIDGTFYSHTELSGRNMKKVPHPTICNTMDVLSNLSLDSKKKVHFIHLNHTNILLDSNHAKTSDLVSSGYNIAYEKQTITLK